MNHSSPKKEENRVYKTAQKRASASANKIAEPLAVYTTVHERKTTNVRRRLAGIPVADEVWRFAARNDLLAHLETAVRLAKECFKKIDQFGFSYDVDPEIENECWINLHARIKGTFDELLQEDSAYTRAMVRALPLDKQTFIRFFSNVECEG